MSPTHAAPPSTPCVRDRHQRLHAPDPRFHSALQPWSRLNLLARFWFIYDLLRLVFYRIQSVVECECECIVTMRQCATSYPLDVLLNRRSCRWCFQGRGQQQALFLHQFTIAVLCIVSTQDYTNVDSGTAYRAVNFEKSSTTMLSEVSLLKMS